MKQIVCDRRALHRIPELVRDLPRTMEYLRNALSGLSCQLTSPIPNSLCAWFDKGADAAIAFRSDADALPISETTNLPFASEIPGHMHACGHDGHMSMLLELARRLDTMPADRNFLLIFQPAEETTGGAEDICKTGILEEKNVQAIFALHIWPKLPKGLIFSRKNELMARSCELDVEIIGRSSHIAQAENGIDALLAGAEFIRRARQIELSFSDDVYRLLRFGKMSSGNTRNIVSDRTRMEGTLRSFQDDVHSVMLEGLKTAAVEISQETGCEIRVSASQGYPAVINTPEVFERVLGCGVEVHTLERPSMITEDFSWYQKHVPGMLFFLGAGDCPMLHTNSFNFDEAILDSGASFLEALARNYR